MSAVRGTALQGGYIGVLPTPGRHGQSHPQLPLIAPSGGLDGQGQRWEPRHYLPYALRHRTWQGYRLRMVRQTLKTEAINQLGEGCFTP